MYPKLLIQLLLPLALATLTLAAENPLCEGAMAGTFNGSLLSITPCGDRSVDFILKNYDQFIEVNPTALTKNAIKLDVKNSWRGEYYKPMFYNTWNLNPRDRFRSFYEICIDKTCRYQVHMNSKLYIFDSDPSVTRPVWAENIPAESYSLVFSQLNIDQNFVKSYQYSGFIITRDQLDKTDHLVISDLIFHSTIPGMPPHFRHYKFYYLDDKYKSQFTLIHRKHRKNLAIKTPFSYKPPPGFVKDGLMHLFDDLLGCVRIVKLDGSLDAVYDNEESVGLPMVNVPYEKYFKCPEQFKPKPGLDPNRCGPLDSRSGFLSKMGHVSLMVASFIALALLLVGAALCFVWVKSKKKKAGSRAAKRSSSSHSKGSRSASKDSRGKASRSGSKASRGASAGSKAA